MAKCTKNRSRSKLSAANGQRRWLWAGVALAVLLGVVGLFLFLNRTSPTPEAGDAVAAATVAVADPVEPVTVQAAIATSPLPDGRADYCRNPPAFPAQLGFGEQTFIGTSLRGHMGLTLSDPSGRVYQDETWDDAGHLGPFIYDRDGNIYTAPAPFVNLVNNAPEDQGKIYKVDAATGMMAEWIDLPAAATPSQQNPFGVLGLFYDCDTDSIYAGSIAGSTAGEEVGRLFHIDRQRGDVAAIYEGVGVFNGVSGKRLYYGSGRDSGVRSMALDETGDFVGEPRVEFFLAQFEEGGNEKAQRITFNADNQMVVKGLEFNYSLRAASETARILYTLAYDGESDGWNLVSIERSSEWEMHISRRRGHVGV